MVHVALLARLEARPDKSDEVAAFLASALPLARAEAGTTHWYALRLGPTTFGVFDTFATDAARDAHLSGPIASALMARAGELLSQPPVIEKVELLAVKA